jgi:tetratricopeptide (TPR) repeat protein
MGDLERAFADFGEAIRLRPYHPSAYFNRGLLCARKGIYGQAIADFSEVIRLTPKDVEAFYNRSVAHKKNGDVEEAAADLAEASRLDPGLAITFKYRGDAFSLKVDQPRTGRAASRSR